MRLTTFLGLVATVAPLALGQEVTELPEDEALSGDEVIEAELAPFDMETVTVLTAAAKAAPEAEDEEALVDRVRVELTFSTSRKYDIDEQGYVLLPRNGRAIKIEGDIRLRNISVESGPCAMAFRNQSESDMPVPELDVVQQMKFDANGGSYDFRSPSHYARMEYLFCGAEGDFQEPGSEAQDCANTFKGDLATDLLDVCCTMPTQWKPELWKAHEMDAYLKDAIDHWNQEGWPTSIIRTFAEYNQEEYIRADEQVPEGPMWQWNCDGIHSDRCQLRDLSYRDACVQDPKRVLLLQALENFANMWQTQRTRFDQDALTDIVMILPNISRLIFPNVANDKFDAPGDYNDATWTMIGGGIAGLIAIPFSFTPAAPIAGAVAGVVGGIMWLVGLALGPQLAHFQETDPHFTMFADFSEDVGKQIASEFYRAYEGVYNKFFMEQPSVEDGVNATTLGNIFRDGALIQPVSSESVPSDLGDYMANTFLSPIVNLAWQRQNLFLAKIPSGGVEIWRHSETDPTDTRRDSIVYDPCGDHDGVLRYRRNFVTAERNDDDDWRDHGSDRNRHVCTGNGEGYMIFAWTKDWEDAWQDYGWEEMERRGLKKQDIVDMSVSNQAAASGFQEHAQSIEERLTEMVTKAASLQSNPGANLFWNLPICDLTYADDQGPGLIQEEGCGSKWITENGRGTKYLDDHSCIALAFHNWCKDFKPKEGWEWPYGDEDED